VKPVSLSILWQMPKPVWRPRATKFHLAVVDIMLPNKDGWRVVAEVRRDGLRMPILFLFARDGVRNKALKRHEKFDDFPHALKLPALVFFLL
jgi:DNA-binding response OmpR family regulator